MVDEFREKTLQYFRQIEGYTAEEIEEYVKSEIESFLEENSISEVKIKEVVLYGSRSRGAERSQSDIDVLVFYESPSVREDALFNLIGELKLTLGELPLDINPIREQETGLLDDYLAKAEKYMEEKLNNKEGKNMLMMREFKDENGNVLCGADICEYHTSVKNAMKDFHTFESFVGMLNRVFEEQNEYTVRSPKGTNAFEQQKMDCDTYDIHVAESHVNDYDVQMYIKKYPEKLMDPLGNYMLQEIAEIYYALQNGLKDNEIFIMIENAATHENMRVIRRGFEKGMGDNIMLVADLKDVELQSALLAGLLQGVDKECVEMMRKAHSCVTVHVVWNGVRNGLSMEDAAVLLELEQAIVKEREKYFDALNDTEIDTYHDMLTLLNVCMDHGKDAARELAEAYIDGIKIHAGTEYNIKDIIGNKKDRVR